MARISELEERFYEEMQVCSFTSFSMSLVFLCACHVPFAVFQASNEITQAMAHPLYDIVNGLPEIDAYMERLQGSSYKLDQFLKVIKIPILSNANVLKILLSLLM